MIVKSETGAEHEQEQWGKQHRTASSNAKVKWSSLDHTHTQVRYKLKLHFLWFALWFNCYNLIIKYVPEKPLKDAFYNYHKADYTIESKIPKGG